MTKHKYSTTSEKQKVIGLKDFMTLKSGLISPFGK